MASKVRFGDFVLDLGSGELECPGGRVRLQELPFRLLKTLVNRPGETVTRDELIAALWPRGVVVDFDAGLNTAVRKLRAALGDEAGTARYIETLPRRGYRLIPPVSLVPAPAADGPLPAAIAPAPRPSMGLRLRTWLALAGLIAAVALGLTLLDRQRAMATGEAAGPAAQAALPQRSIAVLPFKNLADPTDAGFLAAGLSESVLHQLSTLQEAKVIARGSSFSLQAAEAEPRVLGQLLNAGFLLTGSVQRQGDALRVIATLTDAASGEQLWSTRFDRTVTDIFAVQDEIATQVARALRISIDATATARLAARGTGNIEAYMEYLEARGLAASLRHADLQQAAAHYRRAISLDPQFSAAYSGLADALVGMLSYRENDAVAEQDRQYGEALALLRRAVELDKSSADAYVQLSYLERDPEAGLAFARKAVELNPNLARAHARLAGLHLSASYRGEPGRVDEFFPNIDRAIELDPLELDYRMNKHWGIFTARTGRMAEAGRILEHALEIDPRYFPALTRLGELRWCCERRVADGVVYLERALAVDPTSSRTAVLLIHMYLTAGDFAAARQLQRQFPQNSEGLGVILAHERDWQAAARLYYQQLAAGRIYGDHRLNPTVVALRMEARRDGDYGRLRRFVEELDPSACQENVVPRLGTFFLTNVICAESLHEPQDQARRRRILESTLQAMDRVANEFQRGDFWFPFWRSRTLLLLGRDQEALAQVELIATNGQQESMWELEFDPLFDPLRGEPRFQAALEDFRRYQAEQRERIEALRRQGIIPRRG